MTELSELIADYEEQESRHSRNFSNEFDLVLGSSGDSIHSEPPPVTSSGKFNYDPSGVLSDPDSSYENDRQPVNDGVTNLEFLVEESDGTIIHYSLPSSPLMQDNTDLEDLLDDDDLFDDADDLFSETMSDSRSVTSSRKYSTDNFLDDEETIGDSSSEGYTSEDEIRELKAKHERDMLELLKQQEMELLQITDQVRKTKLKNGSLKENSLPVATSKSFPSAQTLNDLHDFIYDQQKTSSGNLLEPSSTLCI